LALDHGDALEIPQAQIEGQNRETDHVAGAVAEHHLEGRILIVPGWTSRNQGPPANLGPKDPVVPEQGKTQPHRAHRRHTMPDVLGGPEGRHTVDRKRRDVRGCGAEAGIALKNDTRAHVDGTEFDVEGGVSRDSIVDP